jgi:single-strand DNA-binding protein
VRLTFYLKLGNTARMKHINHVKLLGLVGRDAKVKSTLTGKRVANWSLGTTTGAAVKRTDWHDIVCWEEMAAIDVRKGQTVLVEGKLHKSMWTDNQNKKHFKCEIVAYNVVIQEDEQRELISGYKNTCNLRAS